ncbi:hypothetical protein N825_08405 [Skermanella stibiiresistens SB22]|uniref:Nudix hydrolase domain-containing protein n=1 Tax=Skermanella stibiiresistens SB22 TaxID=1385369 RepID=W9H5H8_9PROT|nr:NUDIX domain-containing protein [Skermanella stibiiresistens]EWY39013.1 hypothetical protein N825_08405 [Skermanella stibiiresistens SB22]
MTGLREAATLILLRDTRHGFETLMIERHGAASFAAGALVFPGGCVDAGDRQAGDDDVSAARSAAIRETFEECGILLVRESDGAPPSSQRQDELITRYRRAILDGEIGFGRMLELENLTPAPDLLTQFGHWVTPVVRPKRFDTRFFVAKAPPDQRTAPDGSEIVSYRWVSPASILRAADAGEVRLIFATRMTLARLSDSGGVAEAIDQASRRPVPRIVPEWVETAEGARLRIPEDAGYHPTVAPAVSSDLG